MFVIILYQSCSLCKNTFSINFFLCFRLQQQDKQQHSDVQVVPSNPSYYPVIQTPFIDSLYKPAVIQTPFMDSLYKPPFTSVEYSSFHDDYNKSVMYAPTKSQVIAVGRES